MSFGMSSYGTKNDTKAEFFIIILIKFSRIIRDNRFYSTMEWVYGIVNMHNIK